MQGKGFEPSDSFETGCLIEPFILVIDLKSCAVGQAWLPLHDLTFQEYKHHVDKYFVYREVKRL